MFIFLFFFFGWSTYTGKIIMLQFFIVSLSIFKPLERFFFWVDFNFYFFGLKTEFVIGFFWLLPVKSVYYEEKIEKKNAWKIFFLYGWNVLQLFAWCLTLNVHIPNLVKIKYFHLWETKHPIFKTIIHQDINLIGMRCLHK